MSTATGRWSGIRAETVRGCAVAIVTALIVLAGAAAATAQRPVSDELQAAIQAADQAQSAYLAELAIERVPSRSLTLLTEEIEELAAAILANYALLEGYRSGAIAVAGPDPGATRTRIIGEISTGIGRQNVELALLTARAERWEWEELVRPVENARRRYTDALAARALAEGAELARPPITVADVAIEGDAPFRGTWRWATAETSNAAATVAALEEMIADVRATIVQLDARLDDVSREAHWASFAWNKVHDELVARAEFEAVVDTVVRAISDLIEVGVAVATAGNWTVVKGIYTAVDLGIRAYGYSSFEGDLAARIAAIGGSRLSEEIRAAYATRLREGLLSEGDTNFAAARSLLGDALAAPSLPVGGIGFEAAKSAVEAWVAWVESNGAQPLSASRAFEWLFSGSVNAREAVAAVGGILEAAPGQRRGFGLSMTTMAISEGVVPFLYELYYGLLGDPSMTTEELTRALAVEELRLFILSEHAALLHSLRATLSQGEPALVEELADARIRLATSGGAREFIADDGRVIDRAGTIMLPQARGDVTVTVRVADARFAWRLEVVEVTGDRTTTLGAATFPTDTGALTFRPPATDGGPPGLIEVRVVSLRPTDQDVDGNPATVPAIDRAASEWIGREAGPDIYRFAFVASEAPICPPAPPDYAPGPVASTFDAGTDGWTIAGDAGPVPDHAPPSAISATDRGDGLTWYFQAPPSFLGDRRSLYGSELIYALRTEGTGGQFSAPDIVLEGGGLTLTLNTDDPTSTWTQYRQRVDETAPWIVVEENRFATAADFHHVLTCVTALRIRGEFTNGPDRGWLGSVSFGPR